MSVNRAVGLSLAAAMLLCSHGLNLAHAKPFMIVGIDEKVSWDDDGKTVLSAPGKDQVPTVDLASPENPKIVASLPLKNSIADRRSISTSTPQAQSRWWRIRWMS
jgi:hypothetical protein